MQRYLIIAAVFGLCSACGECQAQSADNVVGAVLAFAMHRLVDVRTSQFRAYDLFVSSKSFTFRSDSYPDIHVARMVQIEEWRAKLDIAKSNAQLRRSAVRKFIWDLEEQWDPGSRRLTMDLFFRYDSTPTETPRALAERRAKIEKLRSLRDSFEAQLRIQISAYDYLTTWLDNWFEIEQAKARTNSNREWSMLCHIKLVNAAIGAIDIATSFCKN